MIKHIVFLQFKSSITEMTINQVLHKLGELRHSSIPQIKSFSYGLNNSPEGLNKAFNYAFIMEFNDSNERNIYLEHADHQILAKTEVLPLLEDGINSVIVVDFEVL